MNAHVRHLTQSSGPHAFDAGHSSHPACRARAAAASRGRARPVGVEYIVMADAWHANHADAPVLEGRVFHRLLGYFREARPGAPDCLAGRRFAQPPEWVLLTSFSCSTA
jgi:hypothetical protein